MTMYQSKTTIKSACGQFYENADFPTIDQIISILMDPEHDHYFYIEYIYAGESETMEIDFDPKNGISDNDRREMMRFGGLTIDSRVFKINRDPDNGPWHLWTYIPYSH